ncbi:3'(2'),5'-bisphosphate nucleotidase CysQ [Rickettsiella grylli]|uniref:3'(2'),5'-bisphosphate nucleotidase CysQ n=1 Tax=Rickettsiella grylli TaxID=59196 RepID=A8PPH6_9COXI|nr:3'(2'),5'-bisphosphate nucleotidase CysQ [Rickettsiella grylli]EDP45878.1 3'(2'),5'-bisphosphate nucleotidase [Rickettsiella grylli]
MNFLLNEVISLAKKVGNLVLTLYQSDFSAEYKKDHSPITVADLASHECICQELKRLTPDIPIISEESGSISYQKNQVWDKYWLVDPLDGTKEFLEKNDEFTINIALIEQNKPSLGVIFVPCKNICYFAHKRLGAYKQVGQTQPQVIRSRILNAKEPITAVVSRRHGRERIKKFLTQFARLNLLSCGSALKFCWLAEGLADVYPRFSPTFAWDIAAGHCILTEAGGFIIDDIGKELEYNPFVLQRSGFLAVADKQYAWLNYLKPY